LEKIAQEGAEQSHRQIVPSVELLETKQDIFERLDDYDVVLVAYEESAKQGEISNAAKILSETKPDSRIFAVFGREGGLSRDEVDYFVEHKGI
ncbi:RsmE family RNA methyltransferase, partial [Enterococcus faecium]|uniref:RsmE family RNA methyltransferase n=1 Tax=Enterococcus faecium TaxID=1352 RepID=UPI003CC5ABEC